MSYLNIEFSIDLVNCALSQIEFLKNVNNYEIFYEGNLLEKAIYRYEKYWLPLCDKFGDNNDLYAPMDIKWVHHCHMLNPTEYIKDCTLICGKVINNRYFSNDEVDEKLNKTKILWEKNTSVSYDFLDENSIGNEFQFKNFKSSIRYDLKSASQRQKNFYYQISLPHFQNVEFLNACLKRYKKFIYLRSINKDSFLVPCYDIDLIWHTHQCHPIAYSNDMTKILGYVFEHDDSVNDRTPGSKLITSNLMTRDLWMKEFNENYFFNGAMYRGEAPKKGHFTNFSPNFDTIFEKYGEFRIVEFSLLSKNDQKNNYSFRLIAKNDYGRILLDQIISNDKTYGPNTMNNNGLYIYNPTDLKALKLTYQFIIKENTSTKFINVFTKGHKHDSSNDMSIKQVLSLIDNHNDITKFGTLLSNKKTAFEFILSYINEVKLNKRLEFDLEKKFFYNVHMLDILQEYDMFDLENKNFIEKNGEAIRATHLINNGNKKISLYKAEILHIISVKWSSVKILTEDNKLISTAHLIGSGQLPLENQISPDSNIITFNDKYEKAMLIRNLNGDFAIIKGKWVGFNPGRPSKKVAVSPGYLLIDYYSFEKKQIKRIQVDKDFRFTINDDYVYASVDLTSGHIDIRFLEDSQVQNLHVESVLASIFAISVLHVLLQPKIKLTPQNHQIKTQSRNVPIKPIDFARPVYRSNRPVTYVYSDSHLLLSSVGYYELISCNSINQNHYHNADYFDFLSQNDHHNTDQFDSNNQNDQSFWFNDVNDPTDINEGNDSTDWDNSGNNNDETSGWNSFTLTDSSGMDHPTGFDGLADSGDAGGSGDGGGCGGGGCGGGGCGGGGCGG